MTRNTKRFDRRQFLAIASAATVAGLAGCTDGDGEDSDGTDDGNDTDGENDTDADPGGNESNESEEDDGNESEGTDEESERMGIMLFVENENEEPVAQGVSITIDPVEEMEGGEIVYTVESEEALEGGEYEQPLAEAGDYLITAEGDAFETIEREVTVEEGEMIEVTLTLEGAPAEGDDGDGGE